MITMSVGSFDFSQMIQRKIDFLLNNDVFPKEGNEESDRGEQEALEKMLADSNRLTESEFESKFLTEIADLRTRAEDKEYSVEDGDEYYESYSNTLVGVLTMLNPIHLYDLSE